MRRSGGSSTAFAGSASRASTGAGGYGTAWSGNCCRSWRCKPRSAVRPDCGSGVLVAPAGKSRGRDHCRNRIQSASFTAPTQGWRFTISLLYPVAIARYSAAPPPGQGYTEPVSAELRHPHFSINRLNCPAPGDTRGTDAVPRFDRGATSC